VGQADLPPRAKEEVLATPADAEAGVCSPPASGKPAKRGLLRERLKGFEPATFWMASRTWIPSAPRKSCKTAVCGLELVGDGFQLFHREIKGVSGLKPDSGSCRSAAQEGGRRRSLARSRTGRSCGSWAATEPGLQHLNLPPKAVGLAHTATSDRTADCTPGPRQGVQGRERRLRLPAAKPLLGQSSACQRGTARSNLAGSRSRASSGSSRPSARGTLGSSAAIVQANMKFLRSSARLNCE
jgi:hypothetical protein